MKYNIYRIKDENKQEARVEVEHVAGFVTWVDADAFLKAKVSEAGYNVTVVLVDGEIRTAVKGTRV
jgi:hypothetical protein